MRWERTLLAVVMTLAIGAAVVVSIWSGRDLPGNIAGVVLAALSAAFASDAIAAQANRRKRPRTRETDETDEADDDGDAATD